MSAGRSYVVFGKTSNLQVDLSAVAAQSGGFVINGHSAYTRSGNSVSAAGDVNGDGLADLIVGAPWSTVGSVQNAGRSYVVFGKTSSVGIDLSAVAAQSGGFVMNGQCTGDFSGSSVSAAGDVNGDGLADLIVGAYRSSVTGIFAGRSFVVFGKTTTSSIDLSAVAGGTGGFVINGQSQSDYSGFSVSSAGDVNGDGLSDLIVGAYGSTVGNAWGAGRSYVVFGKTSGTAINLSAVANQIGGFVINGQSSHENSGYSVSAAGDVNGDGLADLLVGANKASMMNSYNSQPSQSFVVFGKTSGIGVNLSSVAAGIGGFVIKGENLGYGGRYGREDEISYSVSAAGDVNGDGLADMIIGNSNAGVGVGYSSNGRSYVVFGKTSGAAIQLSSVAAGEGGFVINGKAANEQNGASVSAAGDINGDGLADLIVGAPRSSVGSNYSAGISYVIFGNTTGAFVQTKVDWLGTNGDDTQSDGGLAKSLVAGAGNDILTATAASVLSGGAGNDSFTIDQAMITALQSPMGNGGNLNLLARIDGGSGKDKIILSGSSLTFDLTLVANQAGSNIDGGSRIDSIEMIDIMGSGNNILKLKAIDVLDMGSANLFETNGRQQLLVLGNEGDELDLADGTGTTGWTISTNVATVNGVSCYAWTNNTSLVTVYVQSGVVVN
jgi:hypothetical protein